MLDWACSHIYTYLGTPTHRIRRSYGPGLGSHPDDRSAPNLTNLSQSSETSRPLNQTAPPENSNPGSLRRNCDEAMVTTTGTEMSGESLSSFFLLPRQGLAQRWPASTASLLETPVPPGSCIPYLGMQVALTSASMVGSAGADLTEISVPYVQVLYICTYIHIYMLTN